MTTAILLVYATYYSLLGATSPWWVPNRVLEGNEPPGSAKAVRFADYPYADGAKGYLLRPPTLVYGWDGTARSTNGDRVVPRRVRRWAGQFGLESGLGVSDGIARFGFRARMQFPSRVQFDTDWSLFREHDREGIDLVQMGREHLSIRFAESSRVQFHSGIGPQHFCDARSCLHGIDVTWGFEAFPGRPFLFAFEAAVGNLNQAFAPGFRGRIGYFFGSVEASLGWHQRWIAEIPLGGPFLSVAGWL